ncbi:MAG: phage Gp37/Gp68 family protein [Proteobacteria bacterium]|nr:phage Gp37/Gp68 family protein [Pseudomonadota bacterium]
MKNSGISWTDHTFNPWMGCSWKSPACDNCYAAALAKRWHGVEWGPGKPRQRTSEAMWKQPQAWNRAIEKSGGPNERVFCISMGDIFDAEVENGWRDEVFALINKTPRLDWLLLSKRPREAVRYYEEKGWPDNAWIGTTVEDQAHAYRAEIIKAIPASVRFLSMEPLLEPVKVNLDGIDWVIVGGESGENHRFLPKAWVLDFQNQCREANVPFFFKQWSSFSSDALGHELDGEVCHAFPTPKNRKAAIDTDVAVAE